MRLSSSIIMKVVYQLISKFFQRDWALTHSTSGGSFLGCFVAVLRGQMHFDHAFFFFSCQNWAILWSYFSFVEPAVYQHEEPGVLALLHDWHWENQSHDYCQGKTTAGLACRPETSMTWCLLSPADPVQMYVLQNYGPSFCGVAQTLTHMEVVILLKEKQTAFLLKHNTDKQED